MGVTQGKALGATVPGILNTLGAATHPRTVSDLSGWQQCEDRTAEGNHHFYGPSGDVCWFGMDYILHYPPFTEGRRQFQM